MLQLHPTLSLSNLEKNMVLIEGGEFLMGSEKYSSEKPIHKVKLDDYELCRYLVSQQLWKEVMGSDPEEIKFQNPHRPVERVSWDEIQDNFLPALREKTGDNSWCLPTEAQWEYAARGGKYAKGYTYAGSEQLKEVGWFEDRNKTEINAYRETNPSACKRPNSLGLYDMSGNVFEWCGDKHVVRGGSWYSFPDYARVSDRFVGYSAYRYSYVGFRLCRYSAR